MKRKQEARAKGIAKSAESIVGVKDGDKITNLSDQELIQGLQTRKLSAENVLGAFLIKVHGYRMET